MLFHNSSQIQFIDTAHNLYNTHDLTLVFWTHSTQLRYNLTLVHTWETYTFPLTLHINIFLKINTGRVIVQFTAHNTSNVTSSVNHTLTHN